MLENNEYREGQGQDRDKSVQEDINENIKGQTAGSKAPGSGITHDLDNDIDQVGEESTGINENNKGNWTGNNGKIDASAQGSVMPEPTNSIDESEKPETKVPPSFIGSDSKTGITQNDTNPSKSYHGNPVTGAGEEENKASLNTAEEGIHAENTGGTSDED